MRTKGKIVEMTYGKSISVTIELGDEFDREHLTGVIPVTNHHEIRMGSEVEFDLVYGVDGVVAGKLSRPSVNLNKRIMLGGLI